MGQHIDLESSQNTLLKTQFLKAYSDVFEIALSSNYVDKELTPLNLKNITSQILIAYEKTSKLLNDAGLTTPNLLTLVGPGLLDGHGISLNGKTYCFLDLSVILYHFNQKQFQPETHLLHELIHAVHYSMNDDFSFEQTFDKSKNGLLKKLLAEGIAVSITHRILGDLYDSWWFGFISFETLTQWKLSCESLMKSDQEQLNGTYNEKLDFALFSIDDFSKESLVTGRRGYYIGYKLINQLSKNKTFEEILLTSFEEWSLKIAQLQ